MPQVNIIPCRNVKYTQNTVLPSQPYLIAVFDNYFTAMFLVINTPLRNVYLVPNDRNLNRMAIQINFSYHEYLSELLGFRDLNKEYLGLVLHANRVTVHTVLRGYFGPILDKAI